ncbi:MAG: glycosyltransferase [Blastocatellia bacterium]|nr:glycosyltransferase [Blastocatellia bacterium]
MESKPQDNPAMSVIVPVYNSTDLLKECLAALVKSDYEDFEVIVVDDGSTEAVKPVVDNCGFRYLRIEGPLGPAAARNRGVAISSGELVAFIDSDVCVRENTLSMLARAFSERPDLAGVVGSYDDAPAEQNFLSQYKNLFHHYVHGTADGKIDTFWSGCGTIRRDLFLQFRGFDEQRYRRPSIEDIELGTWMTRAGHEIRLDRRIEVKHLKRWTFSSLLKTDIFRRAVPWTNLMLRAGKTASTLNLRPGQRASVVLVYLTFISIIGAAFWPLLWLAVAATALAVTMLNKDFYRYLAARRGTWFIVRVIPLHWLYFAYCGFSVIWGVLEYFLERVRLRATRESHIEKEIVKD